MNRIRELRQANGWRQEDLATRLNTVKSVVSRYETEQLGLDAKLIGQLCDMFGCTSDYLLCRTEFRQQAITDEDAAVLRAYHALPLQIRQAVDGLLAPYMAAQDEGKMA